jgi:hypothetical protein
VISEKTYMRKLYLISLLSSFAFWLVLIIANLFYSDYYNLDFIRDNNWTEVWLIFLAIIILAFLASVFLFRKRMFLKKFLIAFSIVCSIVTIILMINWIHSFYIIYESQNQLVNEFRKEAESDIKNDNVKIHTQGLPLPPKNEILQIQDDSIQKIRKKYGLTRKNIGCIISPEITVAEEEYFKITELYLEERNGSNWRTKMQNEIDAIRTPPAGASILK